MCKTLIGRFGILLVLLMLWTVLNGLGPKGANWGGATSAAAAGTAATVTKSGTNWTMENEVMRVNVSFASGSAQISSFYNKEANKEYLTGGGDRYLFYYNYGGSALYANDGGWTLGADTITDIMMGATHVGKKLEINISRMSPSKVDVKLVFEIYDGRAGLRYQNLIKNNEATTRTIIDSDIIALDFPNNAHTLHYVPNMTWNYTTGALAPNVGKNAINVYDTGDGWGVQPEMNWKTQNGPATFGELPGSASMLPPFANINAWSGIGGVKVSTNPTALQLVLFPGEEFEYIAVDLTVFNGDIIDGKMAVEEHFRKRFKYNNVSTLFNTNDWEWKDKRNASYYSNTVIPKAKQAGFDMVMLDGMWNTNDYFGSQDSIEPLPTVGSIRTLADNIENNGMILGLWYSMSGGFHNRGRDLADPVMIAEKKSLVESLIASHMSHQMIDLTEYWQNKNVTAYSHPSDNVYRKNVLTRNLMNELVTAYPQYLPKVTNEIDVYPSQADRNNGLLHIGYNGWVTANGDSPGGIRLAANSLGYLPMGSVYGVGKISGKMEDYYSYMAFRNVKFAEDPGNESKWPQSGIDLMGKFNEWRKSSRIRSMTEELYRPVFNGANWDGINWDNNGPYVWMYTDDSKSKALLIATAAGSSASKVTANLRWLNTAKSYSVADVTLDDSGDFTLAYRGSFTGAALKTPGLTIDLNENTSKAKAFWIQENAGSGLQVLYADEKITSYTSSVGGGGTTLTVNVIGQPNSVGYIVVANPSNQKGIARPIAIGAGGTGSAIIATSELLAPPSLQGDLTKPLVYEFETLPYNVSAGIAVNNVNDSAASGGRWSVANLTASGQWVEYTLQVPRAGVYNVKLTYKGHEQRGIGQLYIDGQAQGPEVNQLRSPPAYQTADLGNVTFGSAGAKTFRFQSTGTTSTQSTGKYLISSDAVTLTPVKVPIPYEAESSYKASSVSADTIADSLAHGGAWSRLVAGNVGDWVEYKLNVPYGGKFDVKIRYKAHEQRGIGQWSVNGQSLGTAIDQYASPPVYKESTLGSVTFAAAGDQVFRFQATGSTSTQSTGKFWLSVDSITLTPNTAPLGFEAENMPYTASTSADTVNDSAASGGKWHRFTAGGVGDWIQYNVNVPYAGTFNVKLAYKAHEQRGIARLYVNGFAQGMPFDMHDSPPVYKQIDLGKVTFIAAGEQLFRFVLTGSTSTESSGRYWLGTDAITLTPLP